MLRQMSREELGKAVDITYSQIWRIEQGKALPLMQNMGKIAHALGLKVDQLVDAARADGHSVQERSDPPAAVSGGDMAGDDITMKLFHYYEGQPENTRHAMRAAWYMLGLMDQDAQKDAVRKLALEVGGLSPDDLRG